MIGVSMLSMTIRDGAIRLYLNRDITYYSDVVVTRSKLACWTSPPPPSFARRCFGGASGLLRLAYG